MSGSTHYPRSLSYFVNRIQNYSRNTFKILPYRTDSITPSQVLVFELPSNALIDSESMCLRFQVTTTTGSGYAAVPKNVENLIDRIVVEVNGTQISTCSGLNHVYNSYFDMCAGDDLKNRRKIMQKGAGVSTSVAANETAVDYCIHNFFGFLGSVKPEVIDTAILSNMRVHIYLAPASSLVISAGATGATYTLNSVSMFLDTLSIDDSTFYSLKDEYLNSGGVYSMPFTNIYQATFSQSTQNQSSRFSVNTGSLDLLSACFLTSQSSNTLNTTTKTSDYFNKNGSLVTGYNFEVGGVMVPQFQPNSADAFPLALSALNVTQDSLGGIDNDITSLSVWQSNNWVAFARLNHNCDPDERCISGLDSKGSSMNVVFKSTQSGTAVPSTVLVNAFTTSILEVAAGKQINIIS